jgi:hypothetical protein
MSIENERRLSHLYERLHDLEPVVQDTRRNCETVERMIQENEQKIRRGYLNPMDFDEALWYRRVLETQLENNGEVLRYYLRAVSELEKEIVELEFKIGKLRSYS